MFKPLSQLISQAGLASVHIMVTDIGNGRLNVTFCPILGERECKNDALRSALSAPLNIEGACIDLEEQIAKELDAFCGSVCSVACQSNFEQVIETHQQAHGAEQSKLPEPEPEPSISNATANGEDSELF